MKKTSSAINSKVKAVRLAKSINNLFNGIDAQASVDHNYNVVVECDAQLTAVLPDLLHAYGKGDKLMPCVSFETGRSMFIVRSNYA